MIEAVIIICSILSLNPVEVDCNNEWQIVFYNQENIKTPYGIEALGYAWYVRQLDYGVEPFFYKGRPINAAIGNSTMMTDDGDPILWHEIRHLVCECTWHE